MAAIPGFVQVITDDFNRANQSPLAGNWTIVQQGVANFALTSNAIVLAAGTGSATDVYARYNPWASSDDQYSQADTTSGGAGAGAGAGVVVRMATSGAITMYRLVVDNAGNYVLTRRIADAGTLLRTGTLTYAAGTKLGLSIIGATLKIWYGGVQVGADIVDGSPLASGQPGIGYSSDTTTITLDNWDAGIPASGFRKNALKPRPFKPAFVRR
jgi:hypothetical protein